MAKKKRKGGRKKAAAKRKKRSVRAGRDGQRARGRPGTPLQIPGNSHLAHALIGLAAGGWRFLEAPSGGRLPRNGQPILLRGPHQDLRIRLFAYKVTTSSRGKPHERRIEITSTYAKNLRRRRGFQDVALGYDSGSGLLVGVDPRRFEHGGPTGNASTFFDRDGLSLRKSNEILVRPRAARLFRGEDEFHAFFAPLRIAEYLFNLKAIHAGAYTGHGLFADIRAPGKRVGRDLRASRLSTTGDMLVLEGPSSKPKRAKARADLVKAYERGDTKKLSRAKMSAKQFADLMRQCNVNGRIGEYHVLRAERRRLRLAGRLDLARKVRRISEESVCEGYDILSYEVSGGQRFIEVKATSGTRMSFPMSDGEWKRAEVERQRYYIFRVVRVRSKPEIAARVRDPVSLEAKGKVVRSPAGWMVTLA